MLENTYCPAEITKNTKMIESYIAEQTQTENLSDIMKMIRKETDFRLPLSLDIKHNYNWQEFLYLKALSKLQSANAGMAYATTYFVHKYILGRYDAALLESCLKSTAGLPIFSLGITEPNGGSDLLNLSTTATRQDNHYVLCGEKSYISNAAFADYICILAMTSNNGTLHDYSLCLVNTKQPGISIEPIESLGNKGVISHIKLDNVLVSEDELVAKPGLGLMILLNTLQIERLIIAYRSLEHAKLTYQQILMHARNRKITATTLSNMPLFQQQMTQFWIELSATSELVYQTADNFFKSKKMTNSLAAMCKLSATKIFIEISDYYVQVSGAFGFHVNAIASQRWADSLALTLAGGSDEILLDTISQSLGA